jgi:serine/threonine protein kinase
MSSSPTDDVPSAPSLEAPVVADVPSPYTLDLEAYINRFFPSSPTSTPTVTGSISPTTTTTAPPGVLKPKKELRKLELALFHYDEVIRGDCLGHGGFSDVYVVQQFKSLSENDENSSQALDARHYYTCPTEEDSADKPQCRKYAIKCLKDHFDNPKMFRFAAKDMETEATILANIDHPNIIRMYAKSITASATKASKCTKDNAHDFFIVVDRLSSTLTDKIARWKSEKERMVGRPFFSFLDHSHVVRKNDLIMERVRIAYDVASALAYLHKERIIYRDLKADNIGFDLEGKCKLFDFGLARRLPTDPNKQRGDTYVMSGKTGSLLLMAPEVFNGLHYNQKADVYSFAMLLWKMLALELPYLEFLHHRETFENKVMQQGKRPSIQSKWPKEIQNLLVVAWSKDMDERPTMQEVCIMLKALIVSGLSRRSDRSLVKRSSFM